MKNWTNSIALALAAATLTLTAACTEDRPGSVADVPTPEPGDPAIYAPDGWPLQIGDRVSWDGRGKVLAQFQVPLSGERSPWLAVTFGVQVVGNRVYAPRFVPLDDGDSEWPDLWVYRGHFPIRFEAFLRNTESDLPSEFHGKVEYQTPQNPRRWPDDLERRR